MRIVGRDDSARRSPAIIAFIGLTIKIGRGGVLLRPSHAYLTNFQSGGAEPLPYKGLCTLEELCELHSLQFLLRRAESKNAKHSLKFVSELRRRALQFVRRNTATNSNLNNRRSAKQSLQDRLIMHSAFQRPYVFVISFPYKYHSSVRLCPLHTSLWRPSFSHPVRYKTQRAVLCSCSPRNSRSFLLPLCLQ